MTCVRFHGSERYSLFYLLCFLPSMLLTTSQLLSKLFYWVFVLQITSTAMRLVTFVTRKRRVLALFRTFSTLNLKKPAPTRFAFYFLVLERLVVVKDALRRMVSSVAFRDFTDLPHSAFFQSTVYGDEFWRAAEEISGILLPIYRVLHLVDREGCTLGLIYEFMERIGEGILLSALDEHRYDSSMSSLLFLTRV
ncbi:hypothetical protein O6H91_01G038300 [Diphasiastrum complanatum]|uniref:Uncharacterized protein n=1 Tax=Diphasiastrum complanatum TaxID=34168 RepID=A0ACC2EQ28_DIPCM|nr:hypothetical protein O6H91_01G038300 [Diphasiastrum complanatum]